MNIRRSHSVGTQERAFEQFTPWPFRPQQKSVRSIIVVTSLHTEVTPFHDIISVYQIVFALLMRANCLQLFVSP